MSDTFKFHDLESAPEASKELLSRLFAETGRNGFYAVLAESPETLKAYTQLHNLFMNTSFTDEERTVIWQTINVEHECTFCVPAHTAMAKHMNILEVVLGLSQKTISNYINHLAKTPMEEKYSQFSWTKP